MQRSPIAGGIYFVADEHITFGDDHDPHPDGRRFVVLSATTFNDEQDWRLVLGCPLSSSTTSRTRLCVKLGAGESGCVKKSWIRVPALQPIAKRRLGDLSGTLTPQKLLETQTRVAQYIGLVDDS